MKTAVSRSKPRASEPKGWIDFRDTLPHQKGEFRKRNWGHPWHSLCSFQGKLKPSIAYNLVQALLPEKPARLLDPFAGVGTIPLEARLAGHTAFGFDLSPAAIAISRAKIEPFVKAKVDQELDELESWINQSVKRSKYLPGSIKFNGPLEEYFHQDTFNEILCARAFFQERGYAEPARALVLSCLLHVLHGNRPYALSRTSHPITPFAPTGKTEYRPLVPRVRSKVAKALFADQPAKGDGRIFQIDATDQWPEQVRELDAIITSPPFFDSTRFYSANWMRLWLAGWEPSDFKSQPDRFVERRQKTSFEVYEAIFAQASERLKRGGFFALHLGKSTKCDMAAELVQVGSRFLDVVDQFDESVAHCESHGIRDKGTVTAHQYVLLMRR